MINHRKHRNYHQLLFVCLLATTGPGARVYKGPAGGTSTGGHRGTPPTRCRDRRIVLKNEGGTQTHSRWLWAASLRQHLLLPLLLTNPLPLLQRVPAALAGAAAPHVQQDRERLAARLLGGPITAAAATAAAPTAPPTTTTTPRASPRRRSRS
eukprot:GHVU01141679.1.p1 GENE.GHVU01141679.1~~GHVU01141679.1.p1  ORF type:complete len:153 (-),score=22.81 GHVU01141679.1:13-471(-)